MTVTIVALSDPIAGTVDASGTNSLASAIAVRFVDGQGGIVGPVAASIVGTTWHVDDVDVSALADGLIVCKVIETPSSGPLTFDAKAATKRTAAGRHLTCEPWATHLDVRASYAPVTTSEMDLACWIASDLLFLLSGSRWPGTCVDKVRPQARWRPSERPQWWSVVDGMRSSRFGYCSCNRGPDFGCSSLAEIELPHGPVDPDGVTVKVDGIEFVHHKILDKRWLVRTDGNGWQCCQRTDLDDTEEGTWSVEYGWGTLPDAGGTLAAAALGYQLSLAFRADSNCKLPRRVQSITRGSTTIALLDPMTLFKDGIVGLSEVDLWLAAHQVGNSQRGATIGAVGRRPQFRRDRTG